MYAQLVRKPHLPGKPGACPEFVLGGVTEVAQEIEGSALYAQVPDEDISASM